MEPLQQDDPRQIGPYTTLARFGESAVCVRYLADGADGAVSVVSVARPELAALAAFRSRFRSETRRTERLAGGWVAPIESRTDGDPMWTASPYVPALSLREAIALGGPLPERALRTLGAGLAETLSRVHAGGAVLHGLAPDTVLLAADGPRLTAFGALGAAAVAEAHPDGQLTVRLGYLTPEQASGSQPGPASDIFVLGLLLAYAATGTTPLGDADRIAHAEPELDGVPSELRSLVASCLAKLPEDRPSAGTVAAELALEGAAALARDGWLPPGLVQAVQAQAAEVESLRSGGEPAQAGSGPTDAIPQQHAGGSQGTVGAPEGGQLVTGGDTLVVRGRGVDRETAALGVPGARTAPVAPAAPVAPVVPAAAPALPPAPLPVPAPAPAPLSPPPPAAPDRRALLVGIAAGVAGIALGGGAVHALGDDASKTVAKPAPTPSRTRVAGVPPEPVWRYEHPGKEDDAPPNATAWGDKVLVLTGTDHAVGVDVRSGRRLWQIAEAASPSRAVPVDAELCFVDGESEFLWISVRDGRIKHRVAKTTLLGPGETLTVGTVTGWDGSTLWMTGHIKKGAATTAHFLAYDLVARTWQWRTQITKGQPPAIPRYDLIAVRAADIVVRQDAASLTLVQRRASKGASVLLTFDRKTGRQLQTLALPGIAPTAALTGDAADKVFATSAGELHAYAGSGGKRLWRLAGAALAPGETGVFPFGKGVLRGSALYVANRHQEVCAVDTATGRALWRRSTEAPVWSSVPATAVSASGGTVLAGDGVQLTAFAGRDGRRLWKFQEAGASDVPGGPRYVPLQGGGRMLVVQRERTFYALPVD
ncbi:PQQ-binding-like beta-propeller repeat protein [Streptomyces sp. NBC_00885]|uniref:outer membrane protein assembly factor BamB family protein n=1 Tax=Streptomyces sp. NBC_00885 TaxID=2975857 RepID=UPI00386F0347|nr:PQQ-binding-like beta-propeller repeat protein [Streptomyces sp. NBC_00885]